MGGRVLGLLFICYLFLLFPSFLHAYNPDAGLATNFISSASLSVSSNQAGANINNIRDGNINTEWTSEGCLPYNWMGRGYVNKILNACATNGVCSSTSSSTTNINYATDGDASTLFAVAVSGAQAVFTLTLPVPSKLFRVGLRLNNNADVAVQGFTSGSSTPISLGTFPTSAIYSHQNFLVTSTSLIATIKLVSSGQFLVNDFGVSTEECFEYVIADLGSAKPIATIITKTPTDDNAGFSVLVSTSFPYNWQTVFGPTTLDYVSARYVMFKVFNPNDWKLMHMYEARLYDKFGIYGAPYAASRTNSKSYVDILGVNGIWGWGTGIEPQTSVTAGPRLFVPVASHARNYHGLNWDLNKPTDVVYYNTPGTPAQSWLDWNVVYGNWKDAGFKVIDASIQFTNETFPEHIWPDPYANAYTYGKNFASNFGPSHKNLINLVEVGNEPWDYSASFYVRVLEGMAKGFKDGDPNILVAPGAFQADTPDVPPQGDGISWTNKYAGYRISETALRSINVLNSHCYSYATVSGVSRGVRPEYPGTTFKGFRNMLRWRDVNAPSNEVWLTEWGWDGSSNCVDSRCVSLASEAVYGVRGLLIGAREGLSRMTWFFYADGGSGKINYDNSGLVYAPNNGVFNKKPVYYCFANFLHVLGRFHHVAALREGNDAYVYILTDGTSYKLVAWLPVDGDVSTNEQTLALTISGYSLSGTSFQEINTATAGPTTLPTTSFIQSGPTVTMRLSGYPRVATVIPSGATSAPNPAPTPALTPAPTPAPTPTPTPASTQTPCGSAVIGTGTGLRGDYYLGTNFDSALGVRTDSTINFSWTAGPGISNIPANSFSARWSGTLTAKYTGVHSFYTVSDDGLRLTISGASVIDLWTPHGSIESTGSYSLVAGQSYSIVLEYFQAGGQAVISLSWSSPCFNKEIIPASQLTPKPLSICD